MRVIKGVIVTILAFVSIIVLAVYFGQRGIIFPAPNSSGPVALEVDVENIPLDIGHAYLALPFRSTGRAPLIVYAHGNGELAHWNFTSFDYFRKRGFAVLFLEYPGYGSAPGKPSAESTVASGLLALDKTIGRDDIDSERVIVYGRSIGGGVVSQIAFHRNIAAVILESSFTSLKTVVADAGFPSFLLRDHFDTASVVSELDQPMLLYHGTRDRIIPVTHSEKLAVLAKRATFLKADCGHNDCPRPWEQIFNFLEAAGLVADKISSG